MFVKISGQNTHRTLDYIKNITKRFSTEPMDINFLDETLQQLYVHENNFAKLISIFD
jgi:hypothetical protein